MSSVSGDPFGLSKSLLGHAHALSLGLRIAEQVLKALSPFSHQKEKSGMHSLASAIVFFTPRAA